MKKFVRAFVVMAVCLMASAPACMAYGADVNNLVINDQAVEKNVYVSEDGYVMLPLRATAQLLGYEVTWNSIDSSAKLVKRTTVVKGACGQRRVQLRQDERQAGKGT